MTRTSEINKLWNDYLVRPTDHYFSLLYPKLRTYLLNYLYKYFPSLSKLVPDAVDLTIIAVVENRTKFDPSKATFITWSSTISRNYLLGAYRLNKRESVQDVQSNPKYHTICNNEDPDLLTKERIEAVLQYLENSDSKIANLMYEKFNGSRYVDNTKNLSEFNTMKTRIRAEKRKIREYFKNNELFADYYQNKNEDI